MPRAALTRSFLHRVICPPSARKVDFFDIRQPGFMLEVRNSGGKTYYQRYRDCRGRERQFKIGPAGALTLRQARRKARQVVAEALLGSDPHQRRQELRTIPTLTEFVRDRYMAFAQAAKRSWQTDETLLRLHILPTLGKLPLDDISNQSVADLLRGLRDSGYASGTTNRVLVLLRFIYNTAKKWGIPGATDNPTVGFVTEPDVCRQRFLSRDETQRLVAALDVDDNQVAAKAIKLLLLTGARRNEITKARWEYVDWDSRTLLVPVSKTGRPRLITLNGPAVDLLRSITPVLHLPLGDNRAS